MTGIFLLVSLFTQLTPSNLFALSENASLNQSYLVDLASVEGLHEGSPVYAFGKPVGTVSAIHSLDSESQVRNTTAQDASTDSGVHTVEFTVSALHQSVMRKGVVALMTTPAVAGAPDNRTVLELFVPNKTSARVLPGETIAGFTSFEEFWSADLPSPAHS